MGDKCYAKCRLIGTKDDYIYAEFNRKNCEVYDGQVFGFGRDLITGARVITRYEDIEHAVLYDPFGAGTLHLYIAWGKYLTKNEVIDELNKLSTAEDAKKYIKIIKDVKTRYKELKKEIRQKKKNAIMEDRQMQEMIRFTKRKIKMIKKANIG